MIQAKCIQKFRDEHDKIYGYRLVDINGASVDIHADDLKNAIRNNQINIVNLTLTHDNRLVDSVQEKTFKNLSTKIDMSKLHPNKVDNIVDDNSITLEEKKIKRRKNIMDFLNTCLLCSMNIKMEMDDELNDIIDYIATYKCDGIEYNCHLHVDFNKFLLNIYLQLGNDKYNNIKVTRLNNANIYVLKEVLKMLHDNKFIGNYGIITIHNSGILRNSLCRINTIDVKKSKRFQQSLLDRFYEELETIKHEIEYTYGNIVSKATGLSPEFYIVDYTTFYNNPMHDQIVIVFTYNTHIGLLKFKYGNYQLQSIEDNNELNYVTYAKDIISNEEMNNDSISSRIDKIRNKLC